MLGLTMQTQAQDILYEAKIAKDDMPVVIVDAVKKDFPNYMMEEFYAVPIEFVEEDIFINRDIASNDDYDTYAIVLDGKEGRVQATYNKDGDLINTVEHLKNIVLPVAVRNSVVKAYPGWSIEKDTYNMVNYSNKTKKERYRLVLSKNGEKIRVYTDAKGHILGKYHPNGTHKTKVHA
jgi:hypothetical protein|tara:strand:- start:172 stop:705 length:534 start_codon:yes stop_codon:yes gene_type:complete